MQAARRLLLLATVWVLLAGTGAFAATLQSATLQADWPLPPSTFSFPGTGVTGAAANNLLATIGSGTGFNGVVVQTFTPGPYSTALLSKGTFQVSYNGGGWFAGTTPLNVGGVMPVVGQAKIKGFGGFTVVNVPFTIGKTQTVSGTFLITPMAKVNYKVQAKGWTAGTVMYTQYGSPATTTGTNNLTPAGSGTLTLVSPTKITTNLFGTFPVISRLTLTYVPEPGTAALLGLGVAGLAALGRRRPAAA